MFGPLRTRKQKKVPVFFADRICDCYLQSSYRNLHILVTDSACGIYRNLTSVGDFFNSYIFVGMYNVLLQLCMNLGRHYFDLVLCRETDRSAAVIKQMNRRKAFCFGIREALLQIFFLGGLFKVVPA